MHILIAVAFHSGQGHTARQAAAVAEGARSVGTPPSGLAIQPPGARTADRVATSDTGNGQTAPAQTAPGAKSDTSHTTPGAKPDEAVRGVRGVGPSGAEMGVAGEVRVELVDVSAMGPREWAVLDAADGIAFGTPTRFGGPSAEFRGFAEATGAAWQEGRWRDKVAAGFTTSAGVSGDKVATLVSLAVFAAQHGMTWVSLGLPPGWLYTSGGSVEDLNRLGGFLGALAQAPSDVGADEAPSESDLRTAEHLGRRLAVAALRVAAGRALVGV